MNPLSMILRAASIAAVALALWSLSSVRPPESYYPLTPGLTWDYEVSNSAQPEVTVQLKVSNTGPRQVGPWQAMEQKVEVGGRPGYRYSIDRKDYIATVGEQSPGQDQPRLVNPPALLLRLPLEVGQTWSSDAMTTVVHPGTRIPVAATIESTADKVEVPAGVFDSCLRVESSGTVAIEAENVDGVALVRIETKLWYVRGVGVVQIERKELTDKPERITVETRYRLLSRTS